MARITLRLGPWLLAPWMALGAPASAAAPLTMGAVVDLDDDDGNGVADGLQEGDIDVRDAVHLDQEGWSGPVVLSRITPALAARVLVDGRPLSVGETVDPSVRRLVVQALKPGLTELDLGAVQVRVRAVQIGAVDSAGTFLDLSSAHASLQRTPPERLDGPLDPSDDPDALRYVWMALPEDLPQRATIVSRSPSGQVLDTLEVPLVDAPCPKDFAPPVACRSTWPIRAVAEHIDRIHRLVAHRSIRAELGGALMLRTAPSHAQQIRIAGPRRTRLGALVRYLAPLRPTVFRVLPGGSPAIAATDAEAVAFVKEQVAVANALWGQCGISFGPPETLQVRLVDPPVPYLVAVGCSLGLPASGGTIALVVDGREVRLATVAGQLPVQVARGLARQIQRLGYRVVRSQNPVIGPGASPTVDLLVTRQDGKPAWVSAPVGRPASTDAHLGVCLGNVKLSSGLKHFVDVDSMAGTVSERALLKWVDDRDPGTLDVVFVPGFERGARIGESFIGSDRSSLRNMVLIDRAGVRTGQASFTVAHEVGHVLLDVAGHPDDFGMDTPTLLMDSDAANASAFGPRRLTIAECERAVIQSGPQSSVRMLQPWPLEPLPKPVTRLRSGAGDS